MPNVVILGDKKDTRIPDALAMLLSRAGRDYLLLSRDGISGENDGATGAEYMIADAEAASWAAGLPANVVVLKSGISDIDLSGLRLAPSACAVIEGNSQPARNALVGTRLTVVSCGMGGRDTVTFSSIDKDHVILTIQRGLVDCFGNRVEEQDIPLDAVVLPGKEYSILAAAAVCVMTGVGGFWPGTARARADIQHES